MNERRIKGRVVDVWYSGTPDIVRYILELEEDKEGARNNRVSVPVSRRKRGAVALLDAAFFHGFIVSMTALYEERSCVMLVHKVKDFKVEDDVSSTDRGVFYNCKFNRIFNRQFKKDDEQ